MTRHHVLALALIFAIIFASGCATVGRKIDPSNFEKIKKGETTKDEVVSLLGSPDHLTISGNGNTAMTYIYSRAAARPETFIPFVGALVGGYDVQTQAVVIVVGPDGKVIDYSASYGKTETRQNLSSGGEAETPGIDGNKRPK